MGWMLGPLTIVNYKVPRSLIRFPEQFLPAAEPLTVFYRKEEINVHSAKTKMPFLAWIFEHPKEWYPRVLFTRWPCLGAEGPLWSGCILRFSLFKMEWDPAGAKEHHHSLGVADVSYLSPPMPRPSLSGFRVSNKKHPFSSFMHGVN